MARAPIEGRCKTRLAALLGTATATALYEAMLLDTIERLGRLPVDRHVVMAAPEDDGVERLRALVPAPWLVVPQAGGSFGERLSNSVVSLWAEGGAVALVSSDSPTIPVDGIARALRSISGTPGVLLGPSDDGGYYLIGLGSPSLGVFDGVPWSTAEVLATTLARCEALGLPVELLPNGYDVDEAVDVNRLRDELARDASRAPRCHRVLASQAPQQASR